MKKPETSANRHGKLNRSGRALRWLSIALGILLVTRAGADLFPEDLGLIRHLRLFPIRPETGDPNVVAAFGEEGPKGIDTADFDGDGNPDLAASDLDGTVTVLLGRGGGDFRPASHYNTGTTSLRGIIATDLNGDGRQDIATAAPFDGQVILLFGDGVGGFLPPQTLETWRGARNLVAGDFDGDGVTDLAVAGPGIGLRHYRGTGGGAFIAVGDVLQVSPLEFEFPKPVYSLATLRSRDGLRDDLVLTHADSDRVWILGTVETDGIDDVPGNPLRQEAPAGALPDTPLIISEFMAVNGSTLQDEDREFSDWIEIFNRSDENVSLSGWSLTTRGLELREWEFPDLVLEPGEFLLVFASGKNKWVPGGAPHTNFKLSGSGEFLALVRPGLKPQLPVVAHSFGLVFPTQEVDISYGISHDGQERYFDLPSPGWVNNAGAKKLNDLRLIKIEDVRFIRLPLTPEGNSIRVEIELNVSDSSILSSVWISYNDGSGKRELQLVQISPGDYEATIPPGEFVPGHPYELIGHRADGNLVPLRLVEAGGDGDGALRVIASLPSQSSRSLAIGSLLEPYQQQLSPDLITASRDGDSIEIRRGNGRRYRFDHAVHQTIRVQGGPRAVAVADLDHDGWNDLIVVLRNAGLVVTFRNDNGTLVRDSEVPAGNSPREVAVADFTGDGQPDAAVINRKSGDITILTTLDDAATFRSLNQIYPVDGEVSSLRLHDFNGDGHDDVILLHRRTNDFSVRLFSPMDGGLGEPTFYPMGDLPEDVEIEDCNEDGEDDIISANQGDGSVSVRLNSGAAGLSSELSFPLTPTTSAGERVGILSAEAQDFNGDGKVDLVALLFDCRIAFYEGNGDGTFVAPDEDKWHDFVYEPRVTVPGDFDDDGDIDLAGVGVTGQVVIVENRGDFLTASKGELSMFYQPLVDEQFNAKYIRGVDVNSDGDLDLLVGTGQGVILYLGTEGVGFEQQSGFLDGTGFPVAGLVSADFDGNGTPDIAVSCKLQSCITLLTQNDDGEYVHALSLDVPAGDFLATGDLDGDGLPDLVGAGDVLWVALSSTPPEIAVPSEGGTRERLQQVVINEILAKNSGVPIEQDDGKNTDFVELVNGGLIPRDLEGWALVSSPPGGEGDPDLEERFVFPAGGELLPGEYQLVIYSTDETRSPYHTGFKLPGDGGTLVLLDATGEVVDRLEFPRQLENISYGRYQDAFRVFSFNPIPSPGRANQDDGPVAPVVEFLGFRRSTVLPDQPIRFDARGIDDVGIISVSVLWQRVDGDDRSIHRLVLFDDGRHGDGKRLDGLYSNVLLGGLPAGAEIQFYLEAEDLSGETQTIPSDPVFAKPGEPILIYSLGVESGTTTLQITEIVANNRNIPVEAGGDPDYIEIRNYGSEPVSLDGLVLAQSFFAEAGEVFVFPPNTVLGPGEYYIVLADENPSQGPSHAPYRINRAGEQFVLHGTGEFGAHTVIDHVQSVQLAEDEAFYRVGEAAWFTGDPSPWADSPAEPGIVRALDGTGAEVYAYIFPTEEGVTYIPRISTSLKSWENLDPIRGDGQLHSVSQRRDLGKAFFSLLTIPAVRPQFDTRLVNLTRTAAEFAGNILDAGGDFPDVTIFYGTTDGGLDPAAWDAALELGEQSGAFSEVLSGLDEDTRYYYRALAQNQAGGTWNLISRSFRTLSAEYSSPQLDAISEITTITARVAGQVFAGSAGVGDVDLFWGESDGLTVPAAWANQTSIVPDGNGMIDITLLGLEPGTRYHLRIRSHNIVGPVWTAGVATFETESMLSAIRESLVISEIMFNPPMLPGGALEAGFIADDFEFIELFNAGSLPLDLSQLRFTRGISFDFQKAVISTLGPGQFAVIARSRAAFESRYGPDSTGVLIGQWLDLFLPVPETRLRDWGERITLTFGSERHPILDFEYGDGRIRLLELEDGELVGDPDDPDYYTVGWPERSDGGGSLVLRDRFARPDPGDPLNWTVSHLLGGSPGRAEIAAKFPIVARVPLRLPDRWSGVWADFDGDGDLDLLSTASDSAGARVFIKSADGTFAAIEVALGGFSAVEFSWADYDGDDDLDAAVAGFDDTGTPSIRIYRNDGGGDFIDIEAGLPEIANASLAWGDFDANGKLDLLLAGRIGDELVTRIYRNEGGDSFRPVEVSLPGAQIAGWGDFDADGDPDILLSGIVSGASTRLFRNDGADGFLDIEAGLDDFLGAPVRWGDFDGDGDLDILLAASGPGTVPRIYRNDGLGEFLEIEVGLPGGTGSVAWGDYDGDGDLDILLGGTGGGSLTRIFRNEGSGEFIEIELGLPGGNGAATWGDYDGDGDLDAFIGGGIYRNDESEWIPVGEPATPPLAITEIMYHSRLRGGEADAGFGDDDFFDFIEIKNIGDHVVELDELALDGSIHFEFRLGAVRQLAPGAFVLVVAHRAAFEFRYGAGLPIAGEWYGRLGNSGGNLSWLDRSSRATTHAASYFEIDTRDDGGGHSLVLGDQAGASGAGSDTWGVGSLWIGSPGADEIASYQDWLRFHFTADERLDPLVSGISADPDHDGWRNGEEYAYNFNPRSAANSASPLDVSISSSGGSGRLQTVLRLSRQPFASDLTYWIESSPDLSRWQSFAAYSGGDLSSGIPIGPIGAAKFYRARAFEPEFPGVEDPAILWGDYDLDGDLDILLAGRDSYGNQLTGIYRNDDGTFSELGVNLPGSRNSSVAWGDYDGDGDLDILVFQFDPILLESRPIFFYFDGQTYIQNDSNAGLPAVLGEPLVLFGDYDGNGALDILVSGSSTHVYRNSGASPPVFEPGAVLTTPQREVIAWGDYDGNGNLDILLAGAPAGTEEFMFSSVHRNSGGEMPGFDIAVGLPAIRNGSAVWGDYDNDGDLDILLVGTTIVGPICRIYRNDEGAFNHIGAGLPGVSVGSGSWGDYDGDGDLDILLLESGGLGVGTRIFRNDEGEFIDIDAGLPGVLRGAAAWGDYDNDGDLDILLAGQDVAGNTRFTRLYRNDGGGRFSAR